MRVLLRSHDDVGLSEVYSVSQLPHQFIIIDDLTRQNDDCNITVSQELLHTCLAGSQLSFSDDDDAVGDLVQTNCLTLTPLNWSFSQL